MAEVAASVALTEAAAQPATISFVDGDASADPAAAIIDEVLAGQPAEAPTETETTAETPTEEGKPEPEKKPEPTPEPVKEAATNDIESAKLRKGFAKLADERQKLLDLQSAARTEKAVAQQYAVKAQRHDEIVAAIEKDPAGFLLTHGGEALVQKALQGFIEQEKSPAEREIAKLRAEQKTEREERERRELEQVTSNWRNGIIAKVQGDDRFDLVNTFGLHADVIGVMTAYYDRHSERDEKGNVTKPAILEWDQAAQAVEDHKASLIEKSKRYGKRAPAVAEPEKAPAKKDATSAKQQTAPVKKAPTSLSSVPVADSPALEDDLPTDDLDERERQLLAQLVG